MWFDLVIFMGVPLAVALVALAFGVDNTDGDDWIAH